MAWFGAPAFWRSRRPRAKDPYSRAQRGELDIIMAPPYQPPIEDQQRRQAEVERLIAGLNGGLDANWASREVLHNLINGWMLEWIAGLDAQRDERQAVLDILVGLASEELGRREAHYEADLARVEQTRMALDVAFEALTGRKASEFVAPELRRVGERRGRRRRRGGADELAADAQTPPPSGAAGEASTAGAATDEVQTVRLGADAVPPTSPPPPNGHQPPDGLLPPSQRRHGVDETDPSVGPTDRESGR